MKKRYIQLLILVSFFAQIPLGHAMQLSKAPVQKSNEKGLRAAMGKIAQHPKLALASTYKEIIACLTSDDIKTLVSLLPSFTTASSKQTFFLKYIIDIVSQNKDYAPDKLKKRLKERQTQLDKGTLTHDTVNLVRSLDESLVVPAQSSRPLVIDDALLDFLIVDIPQSDTIDYNNINKAQLVSLITEKYKQNLKDFWLSLLKEHISLLNQNQITPEKIKQRREIHVLKLNQIGSKVSPFKKRILAQDHNSQAPLEQALREMVTTFSDQELRRALFLLDQQTLSPTERLIILIKLSLFPCHVSEQSNGEQRGKLIEIFFDTIIKKSALQSQEEKAALHELLHYFTVLFQNNSFEITFPTAPSDRQKKLKNLIEVFEKLETESHVVVVAPEDEQAAPKKQKAEAAAEPSSATPPSSSSESVVQPLSQAANLTTTSQGLLKIADQEKLRASITTINDPAVLISIIRHNTQQVRQQREHVLMHQRSIEALKKVHAKEAQAVESLRKQKASYNGANNAVIQLAHLLESEKIRK